MPLTSLSPQLQSGITTAVGPNGQIQTISRDDLANGSVFRVTAMENGIPTELRFAANGTLLGSAPLRGAATSFVSPAATSVTPSGTLLFADLPLAAQSAVRGQIGDARINRISQLQGTNGVSYVVSYDQNGQPMALVVGPDGTIRGMAPATPTAAIGTAPGETTGRGSSTNRNKHASARNAVGTESLTLDELPEKVSAALKRDAKYAEVRYINREERVGGDIYTVGLRNQDTLGELTISADGKILNDTRRNFSELTVAKPAPISEELPQGMPFEKLPLAIQKAVKAYAAASEIRSVILDEDKGKPVYDIVYYKNGQRDRITVGKDGSVLRVQEDVPATAELTTTAKPPVIAVGDLPVAVQDTIRQQTQNVRVDRIGTKEVGGKTVYAVSYRTNGAPIELLVAGDGKVVLPEGMAAANRPSSPLPAPVGKEQPKVVVSTTEPNRNTALVPANAPITEAAGTAVQTERGTDRANSSSSAALDEREPETPARTVSLTDVPAPVQKSAKDLAGNETITSVTPRLKDSGMVYEITVANHGSKRTLFLNQDGMMQNSKGSSEP